MKYSKSWLMEYVSKWPKWKLDSLMLDESDLEIRKKIEQYKANDIRKED